MKKVETVVDGEIILAVIVRSGWNPEKTEFLTPDDLSLQIGMIVYGAGTEIPRHMHLPIVREVHGTSECILVRKGRCEIDIYNSLRNIVVTRNLDEGDIVLLISGGHGFRLKENTVLLEVKQGPYAGTMDKERF